MRFRNDELRRYSRQLMLREVGGIGQARIAALEVGAADKIEALYLAGAGVGRLTVADESVAESVRALNEAVVIGISPTPTPTPTGGREAEMLEAAALRALAVLTRALEIT